MIAPREIYEALLNDAGSLLGEHGFRRTRATFHRRVSGGNWTILNFQTSSKSSRTQVVFTINLGAASDLLARFFGGPRFSRPPTVNQCHWNTRLGFLLPEKQDTWWVIDRETDPDRIINKVMDLLRTTALPMLDVAASDDGLRDLWLRGRESSPFVPDLTRYEYLIVLTTALGSQGERETVIASLREATAKSDDSDRTLDRLLERVKEWRDAGQLNTT